MKHLEALRDYYKRWLERYRGALELAPAVNDALEQVEWELEALADVPPEARNISTSQLDEQAAAAYRIIEATLPMMPEYGQRAFFQVSSISTSTASGVAGFVSAVGRLGSPAVESYASRHMDLYEQLQEAQDRPARVRVSVEELFGRNTLERFDAAYHAIQQAQLGVGTESAAAMEIRTLLDGVKGELFAAACRHPGDNMTWQIMAERVFGHPSESSMRDQLRGQETVRSQLISELSDIGKRRDPSVSTDLRSVWLRTLDHVFIVMNLLKSRGAT